MKKEGMGRRFGLRISRVLLTCRSKDQAAAAAVPPAFGLSPVNRKARDIDFPPLPLPSSAPPSLRHLAPVVASTGCRCGPRRPPRHNPDDDADLSRARETPAYLWRKEEKWRVIPPAAGAGGGESSPRCKIVSAERSKARRRREAEAHRRPTEKKKKPRSRARASTSSADSGWFSSENEGNDEREEEDDDDDDDEEEEEEEDEETEMLLSSFEADSLNSVFRRTNMKPRVMNPAGQQRKAVCGSTTPESAAAVVRKLAPGAAAEGKVRESFAVVKRSEDPHADFRRSMAEMVLEKQIYDAGGLEQLLQCFLSLNSHHHHVAIVSAFSDIWDAIFPAATLPPHTYYQ